MLAPARAVGAWPASVTTGVPIHMAWQVRSEEHTSELQSLRHLVCRLLLEKKTAKGATNMMDRGKAILATMSCCDQLEGLSVVGTPDCSTEDHAPRGARHLVNKRQSGRYG